MKEANLFRSNEVVEKAMFRDWMRPNLFFIATFYFCMFCVGSTSNAQSSKSFIFNFAASGVHGVQIALSGNGLEIAGSSDGKLVWLWSEKHGTQVIAKAPTGYTTGQIEVNEDGSTVAGIFISTQAALPSKIFRWRPASGLQMLPNLPSFMSVGPLRLSDDGRTISFFCVVYSEQPKPSPCNGPPFKPTRFSIPLETWSADSGYESVDLGISVSYDYVRPSGNLTTYLLGQNGAYTYSAPGKEFLSTKPGLWLFKSKQIYIPLVPSPFSFGLGFDDKPLVGVVANNELTYIAAPNRDGSEISIWNASGKLLPKPTLPTACTRFYVLAIDGGGDIFGRADCSNLSIGFRMNNAGTQMISEWMKQAGLGVNIPSNTVIWKVSDDGRLIEGITVPKYVVAHQTVLNSSSHASKVTNVWPPGSYQGFIPGNLFVAYISPN
jgi:hypothetical protein